MAKKNYYAIKFGIDPITKNPIENVIKKTWSETEKCVKGVSGSVYSGFATLPEAEDYLGTKDPLMYKSENLFPKDCLHCYIDGSFNENVHNYGFGLLLVKDNKIIGHDKGSGNNEGAISMQQIGGELLGAMKALVYAKKNGFKEVVLFHDYVGTCYHGTGFWKRDNAFSEEYYQWMQKFLKNNENMKVHFCKVDAHTGDDFNEIADGLAKMSVGLEPEKKFYTYLKKYGYVIS
ncbi:MAG: ribonuclease [Clostridiaceae bacterium]|jgi:ribonuclease HI|nr:ribonuclease [Clostridiaceae bacterium]